jgi:branched-chain amino acid transport system substrate-binding protein
MAESLKSAGVNVVFTDEVSDLTNYSALAAELKAAGVDTITGPLNAATLIRVVPAARAAGVPLRVVLSPSGYDPVLLAAAGRQLAGTSFFIRILPFELDLPPHRKLLDAMTKYAPQIQPPNQSGAVIGWLAADMFIRGIEAAGDCLTRENFIQKLRAVPDYNGGGLIPETVAFATTATNLSTCYQFVQISADGQKFEPKRGLRCGRLLTEAAGY